MIRLKILLIISSCFLSWIQIKSNIDKGMNISVFNPFQIKSPLISTNGKVINT